MIRLAFSEFRNGDEGIPRAHRLSDKLLSEAPATLSEQIRKISESILNLKLFDTFSSNKMVQQSSMMGFSTTKMRLGMTQIATKLFTFEDFMTFLKESPSKSGDNNLWRNIRGSAKCEILEHREYLEIAQKVFKYITNSEDDADHYGNRSKGNDLDDSGVDGAAHSEHHEAEWSYYDDDVDGDGDGDGSDIECDRMSSRSGSQSVSLNQFGESNHAMYREKYFALKRGFVPKFLEHIMEQRGDIEYMRTCGHDVNDTFFMKIGEIKDVLKYLPKFLKRFLGHLSPRFLNHDRSVNGINSMNSTLSMDLEFGGVAKDEGIAAVIAEMAKWNVVIENERDELVHQLITIRIALELFQCVMDTANRFRREHPVDEVLNAHDGIRTPWNYRNAVRGIAMDLCELVMPCLDRIAPMLSSAHSGRSSANSSSLSSHGINAHGQNVMGNVAVNDDGKTDYILKKERGDIYRIMNEMARMVMDSYKKEVYLLRHGFKDAAATDAMQQNFNKDRSFLIEKLYRLFPSGKSVDRWKTDLVKDSVHKIAFDYGDCAHLVTLCDWKLMMQSNAARSGRLSAEIESVCSQRFIDNVVRYQGEFMECYLRAHEDCIEAFLCLEVRQSAVWKALPSERAQSVEMVVDRSISAYLRDAVRHQRSLPVLEEYSWLHDIAVDRLGHTARRLMRINNGSGGGSGGRRQRAVTDLNAQKINLSLAKLAVFADDDGNDDRADDRKIADGVDIDEVQDQLLWVCGRTLLRNVAPNTFDERKLAKMTRREVVEKLIRYCLTPGQALEFGKMEQILMLIANVEPFEEDQQLHRQSLIILLVEMVIALDERDWIGLDQAVSKLSRPTDPMVPQVVSRTAVFNVTKYLFDRKRQSRFLVKNERRNRMQDEVGQLDFSGLLEDNEDEKGDDDIADDGDGGLWRLWKSGLGFCIQHQQKESRFYYATRALLIVEGSS